MYCGCLGRGTKYYSVDQTKKSDSGGDCGKYEEEKGCKQGLGGNTKGKDHLENLGVDGTIRMKLVFKN